MAKNKAAPSLFPATPYREKDIDIHSPPCLDNDGLVTFSANDIEDPKNWSFTRRWCLQLCAILVVVNASVSSSAPSAVLKSISKELHVSHEAANLVTTMYLLGYVFGPLLWGPLSEFYGRRYIMYGTFFAYIASTVLCAFTPDFAGLLIGRFLAASFIAASQSNVPGLMADIWLPIERGTAMALFSAICFVGPSIGPVIGGFLQLTEDFRWMFYVLLMLSGPTIFLMLLIPETFPAQILTNKARRIRRANLPGYENVQSPAEAKGSTLTEIFKVALTRPWVILFDPVSFFVAIYISVAYMLLYMLFTIFPLVFQGKRHWNDGVGELPLLGVVIGAMLAGIICLYDSHLARKTLLAGRERRPEERMYVAMVGGVLFPAMMFIFGWTGQYNSVHWIVPTIAGTFLSTSLVLIFVAYLNYLTDSYLEYTASAQAANIFVRSICGAAAPLFTEYMFDALGIGGGGSFIGGVGLLLLPIPFVFYKYGEKIRKRSKFAPAPANQQGVVVEEDASAVSQLSLESSTKETKSGDETTQCTQMSPP